jgi:hypothetical protein
VRNDAETKPSKKKSAAATGVRSFPGILVYRGFDQNLSKIGEKVMIASPAGMTE